MLFLRAFSFEIFLLLLTSKFVNPTISAEHARYKQSEECVLLFQSSFWHLTPQYTTRLHPPQNCIVYQAIGLFQREQLPLFKSITDDKI